MRDIGARIQRRRLERYRPSESGWRCHRRWMGLAAILWLVYATLLSDHSFYRIWQLRDENRRARVELERMRKEVASLENQFQDPRKRRDFFEQRLRGDIGMAREGEIIYRIQPDSTR